MGVSLPGGGGKRNLDFEVNLVPFIDLLSCIITFLLITAVWTQLARIDINQNVPTNQEVEQPDVPPQMVKILVDKDGYYINLPTEAAPRRIPREADGTYKKWELEAGLKALRAADNSITVVHLGSEDDVQYKEVIGVLDVCLGLGLKDLSMTEAATMREAGIPGAPGVAAPPTAP